MKFITEAEPTPPLPYEMAWGAAQAVASEPGFFRFPVVYGEGREPLNIFTILIIGQGKLSGRKTD